VIGRILALILLANNLLRIAILSPRRQVELTFGHQAVARNRWVCRVDCEPKLIPDYVHLLRHAGTMLLDLADLLASLAPTFTAMSVRLTCTRYCRDILHTCFLTDMANASDADLRRAAHSSLPGAERGIQRLAVEMNAIVCRDKAATHRRIRREITVRKCVGTV
jgi:hypothetical protein